MTTVASETPARSLPVRFGRFMAHEIRHMLPAVVFFFVGFNLILFTKELVLGRYFIALTDFMLATMAALIVGKVVLVP